MTSKSKNKGNSFEREVATFLSELYNDSFVRVPNSGAYVGGSNNSRKQFLNEGQAKSFKGDIIAPDAWKKFNAECKSYADFPFHLVLTGKCKQLDTWLEQLMSVAEPEDINILFIKVTRKGRFICVQSKLTWITDQFLYYTSEKFNDWLIIDFDHFFNHNKDLLKRYSGSISTSSLNSISSIVSEPVIQNIQTHNILSNLK